MPWQEVIQDTALWSLDCDDCLHWFAQLPADSLDLVFGSPPYEKARTYGIGFALKGQAWVDWMVAVFRAAIRTCKGIVAFVLEGQTKDFRWSATPALLMADLHRAGVCLRKPPIFRRVGIPGSGGPDWLRNDYEFIVCASRPGKLSWSENTACGHPPRWTPGGAMSHRVSDGTRINQWGNNGAVGGNRGEKATKQKIMRPSHKLAGPGKYANGQHKPRRATSGHKDGDTPNGDSYDPPSIANPGNVIACKVGGGMMGHKLAHENEAPFPEALSDFFVSSFAPPGGIVGDCFIGSGTSLASAVKLGRRAVGCDVRAGKGGIETATKRLQGVSPLMFQ